MFISVAFTTVFLGLAESAQAVPPVPPANVPDLGSTGLMLVASLIGIAFLKWQLRGKSAFSSNAMSKNQTHL